MSKANSSSTTSTEKGEESITGPHTEYDRYGRATGETYWTCRNCGNQSLYRTDLIDCFDCRWGTVCMSEQIDPTAIAGATGLSEHEVRLVLAQLMPEWLFARYIDDDLAECDYLALRRRAPAARKDDR